MGGDSQLTNNHIIEVVIRSRKKNKVENDGNSIDRVAIVDLPSGVTFEKKIEMN